MAKTDVKDTDGNEHLIQAFEDGKGLLINQESSVVIWENVSVNGLMPKKLVGRPFLRRL